MGQEAERRGREGNQVEVMRAKKDALRGERLMIL